MPHVKSLVTPSAPTLERKPQIVCRESNRNSISEATHKENSCMIGDYHLAECSGPQSALFSRNYLLGGSH